MRKHVILKFMLCLLLCAILCILSVACVVQDENQGQDVVKTTPVLTDEVVENLSLADKTIDELIKIIEDDLTNLEANKELALRYVQSGEKRKAVAVVKNALLISEGCDEIIRSSLLDLWWEILMYSSEQEASLTDEDLINISKYYDQVIFWAAPFYYCEEIAHDRQKMAVDTFFMRNARFIEDNAPFFRYEGWYPVEAIEEEAMIVSGEVIDKFLNDAFPGTTYSFAKYRESEPEGIEFWEEELIGNPALEKYVGVMDYYPVYTWDPGSETYYCSAYKYLGDQLFFMVIIGESPWYDPIEEPDDIWEEILIAVRADNCWGFSVVARLSSEYSSIIRPNWALPTDTVKVVTKAY